MTAIAIATRNAHKAREIEEILNGDFAFLDLNDFADAPLVEENAPTFAGNAIKKAAALADWIDHNSISALEKFSLANTPVYVVADDSGLEVDALGGAPGVHSARFAATGTGAPGNAPDSANNAKLIDKLSGVPPEKRTARFRCVLAVIRLHPGHDPSSSPPPRPAEPLIFEGVCEGRIALAPEGPGGFGYDPLFIPDGCARSFAELGNDVKNTFSHRSVALRKLKLFLEQSV